MPSGHTATLAWLLSLPTLRSVLGDFTRSYFYGLEEETALPGPLDPFQPFPIDWPSLKSDRLRELADAYFEKISSQLPLLTRQYYEDLQEKLFLRGLQRDLETAICLCVWALGCVACNAEAEDLTGLDVDLGLELFAIALKIITANLVSSFTPSLQFCQALVLAALYFDSLGRPLHSWKMMHYAGQQFLQLVTLYVTSKIYKCSSLQTYETSRIDRRNQEMSNIGMRTIFASFGVVLSKNGMCNATAFSSPFRTPNPFSSHLDYILAAASLGLLSTVDTHISSDRAAELDVARNGCEPLGDKMRLPQSTDPNESEDLIYFAAELAIKRLINRIIGSLYSPENIDISLLAESSPTPNNTSVNQLLALSSELNRQLEQYYATIPVQPPMSVDATSNDKRRRLNLRSLYARHLIHRPFVLYVALQPVAQSASTLGHHHASASSRSPTPQSQLHSSPYPMPRMIVEKCHICIQACEAYMRNAVDMLEVSTPYLFTVAQSCVASLVVLYLAAQSPHLRHMVPDLDMLGGTLAPKIRKWATSGSLFEALLNIVELLLAGTRQ